MRTPICGQLGIEYPIFGFSHCRDVVAAVTRSGGFGVLGAGGLDAEELDRELTMLERETRGLPYGLDLVIPAKTLGDDPDSLTAMIPGRHREFVESLYDRFEIPRPAPSPARIRGRRRAAAQMDVAAAHDVRLLATALGPPPPDLVAIAREHSILIAGLVGAPEHVKHHLAAGTDILVAQGTEAGGHTGEITTMTLVTQVVDEAGATPVLCAGGIGDGRQLAAALALGAQGGWLGSVWLATHESDLHPVVKAKLIAASSRDTVRSRCRTGKPVRQLRSPWTQAWEEAGAPETLPAPLQQMLVKPQLDSIAAHGVDAAAGSAVGQVVGMMRQQRRVRDVVDELIEGTLSALGAMADLVSDLIGRPSCLTREHFAN